MLILLCICLLMFPFPNYTSSLKHTWPVCLSQVPLHSLLNTATAKQIILSVSETLLKSNWYTVVHTQCSYSYRQENPRNTQSVYVNLILDLIWSTCSWDNFSPIIFRCRLKLFSYGFFRHFNLQPHYFLSLFR